MQVSMKMTALKFVNEGTARAGKAYPCETKPEIVPSSLIAQFHSRQEPQADHDARGYEKHPTNDRNICLTGCHGSLGGDARPKDEVFTRL